MRRWWPQGVPLRLRAFFRGAFLLLGLATLALALSMLREERELALRSHRENFHHELDRVVARLQHPTGQLALLNPPPASGPAPALRALVLPFSALDFDDRAKAQEAVEMAGCEVQYPDHARLCVAVGNSAAAGGFVYLVGRFKATTLAGHMPGARDLAAAHRVAVDVDVSGQSQHWLAPLETAGVPQRRGVSGQLAAFPVDEDGRPSNLPDREFRGWLWQDEACADSGQPPALGAGDCLHPTFFSLRVPVATFRDALFRNPHRVWPPAGLDTLRTRLRVLAPGDDAPLFDSASATPSAPFALTDLNAELQPGETLRILERQGTGSRELVRLHRDEEPAGTGARLLGGLIRRLPVAEASGPVEARAPVATRSGSFEVVLGGDTAATDRSLARVAARLSWFVTAMLAAILLTWLAIELRIIRRITALTVRAAQVRDSVQGNAGLIQLRVDDLGGRDELGVLSAALSGLLERVNEDVRREQVRLDQARDMWHAVGHEIMSPLQSLSALHAAPGDASARYVLRMQQAVRVLYGAAAPAEAIASADLQAATLDLDRFLRHVARNAPDAGIDLVEFTPSHAALVVKADEYPLEDVITHVLNNADRHRVPGTPIRITLEAGDGVARVRIRNSGPAIAEDLLERIFEYGVSGEGPAAHDQEGHRRGQGLFVARTYMAKMGGAIHARNLHGGVEFVLTLGLA